MQCTGWIGLATAVLAGCAGRAVDSGRTVHEDGAGGSRGGALGAGGAPGAGGSFVLIDPPRPPPDPDTSCGAVSFNPESVPLSVLVLVDRTTDVYWNATATALSRLVELPYVADVEIALGYFAGEGDASAACAPGFHLAMEYLPAGQSASTLDEALTAMVPIYGNAFGPALDGALTFSKTNARPGRRHLVVVITPQEPGPACAPHDAPALSALTAAFSADVGAAVIGLGPGLSTSPALTVPFLASAFVEAGDMAGNLVARLLELIGKSPGCAITLPRLSDGLGEIDYDLVNVQLRPYGASEPETLFFVRTVDGCASNSGEGWYYDQSVDPWKIVLCGGSCERAPGGELQVLVGCPPPERPFL